MWAATAGTSGDAPHPPRPPTRANPMRRLILTLALALPAPALAQKAPAADAAVAAIRSQWEAQAGYLLRAAEQMPDSLYAFRPVATVRSFGQLIGHVAGAQNSMCATALGEPERA